jgi:diguanylate cyclase (GGDEF)-like protein
VLLLSEQDRAEEEVVKGIESGAEDLLSKPLKGPLLVAKVRALLERRRTELQLRDRLRQAEELATTDALTGLANRREFHGELLREISYTRRHSEPFGLLMVDIDHFKGINDEFGHPQGDEVLVQVTERIRETMRASDQAFRIGGDEFGVLLRGADRARAFLAAERLVAATNARPVQLANGQHLSVTISVGVASADANNEFDAQALINRADATLYRAKKAGRGCAELEVETKPPKAAPY